jgi:cytochrome c-type biogenesis protein CcmH
MISLFVTGVALLSLVCLYILNRSWSNVSAASVPAPLASSVRPELIDKPAGLDDREWSLLVQKRDEIEQDPLIDEATRETLRQQWFLSADQVFHRNQVSGLQFISKAPKVPMKIFLFLTFASAVVTYASVGSWSVDALTVVATAPQGLGVPNDIPSGSDRHPGGEVAMADRIKALELRLAQEPDNLAGWALLSRAKASQQDFTGAALALEKALALAPGHPDILADLADMVAMNQGKKLAGRPLDLISQALKSDPDHEKALALAATAAEQSNDKPTAEKYWTRLRAVQNNRAQAELLAPAAPNSPVAQAAANPGVPAQTPVGNSAKGAKAIVGKVRLNEDFMKQLQAKALAPNAAVYITAKALSGSPMPLAVVRLPASQLKEQGGLEFTLDDTTAMSPQMKLSGQEKVNIEARISFGGQANRASGDWIKTLGGVKPGERGITLVIDTIVP